MEEKNMFLVTGSIANWCDFVEGSCCTGLLQCKSISLKVRSFYQKLNYTIYLQYKGVVCYANIKVLTFSINVVDTWGDMKGECI